MSVLRKIWLLLEVMPRLGVPNLVRVAIYRLAMRMRLHPVQWISADLLPDGQFFERAPDTPLESRPPPVPGWLDYSLAFGYLERPLGASAPDFLADILSGERVASADLVWWKTELPDGYDIKRIWEFSRFDWVLAFAQRARSGDPESFNRLNEWLDCWVDQNPAYKGPNWKCAQEAAIRVLHLATAALILNNSPTFSRRACVLVRNHMKRIAPTIGYAIAQDNNHAISEAAGLFVGGSLLRIHSEVQDQDWEVKGRRILEERVAKLIGKDGTFSLYSINYHRSVLDVLTILEVWRRKNNLEPFSGEFYEHCALATKWLMNVLDEASGDTPNLGANDGTRLLNIVATDYRDYRPTVARATALFLKSETAEQAPVACPSLAWLEIAPAKYNLPVGQVSHSPTGGFFVLRQETAWAMLRYPNFHFRPSHADGLHVDLWQGGENILRDAGTFSYVMDPEQEKAFSGTAGHNTVMFDGDEAMPKVGRFLFARWQQTIDVRPIQIAGSNLTCGATIRNYDGTKHSRDIHLNPEGLRVEDIVTGFAHKATLTWRLKPGNWGIEGSIIAGLGYTLEVASDAPIKQMRIVDRWESRRYLQRSLLPVVEIEIERPGRITTLIGFPK